jgi:hypothetical protein
MRLASLLLGAIGLSQVASALNLHDYVRQAELLKFQEKFEKIEVLQKRSKTNKTLIYSTPIPVEYIELPVDHFGDSPGTFKNRYWVQTAEYKPGGPVFIYDGGEGSLGANYARYILQMDGFFMQMVKEFNGIGILWEHRYYGESTPYPINLETTSEQLQYLTAQQALADIPDLAWNFTRKEFPKQDLTPAGTPWVFVGGSYPGMRAAFVRNMYPETIFASYASSAPVQASIDMSFYYEPIWQGMNAYGWGNCTQDIRAAIRAMDVIMEDDDKSFALKEKFLGAGAGKNSNGAFADGLTAIFSFWQGSAMGDSSSAPGTGLGSLCNWLEVDPITKQAADERGWAAVKGDQYVVDRFATWPGFVPLINIQDNLTCAGPHPTQKNTTTAINCDIDQRTQSPDAISWSWQFCSQFGFFQGSHEGPHQLVSKYTDVWHWKDTCHIQFPDGESSGLLPEWPLAQKANDDLGGWDIRPSNTFWVGNQYDPWRTLTPLSDMPFSNKVVASNSVPTCTANGQSNVQEDYLFGYLVPNAEHCFDFEPEVQQGAPARKLFNNALSQWLKCFTPGNSTYPPARETFGESD